MKKINEYRSMNTAELNDEVLALTRETFNLRMQKATGQLSKPHLFKLARRNIARIKTILAEKVGSES